MNLKEYQNKAIETAIYPNVGNNIIYPLMGLCGEVGELSGKLSKIMRDGYSTPDGLYDSFNISKEIGDVCWEIAATFHELNMSFEAVLYRRYSDIQDIQDSLDYDGDFDKVYLEVLQASMLTNSMVEKALNIRFSESMYEEVKDYFVEDAHLLVNKLCYIAKAIGFSITDILNTNLHKLSTRAKTKTLQGSGDDREKGGLGMSNNIIFSESE